MDLVKPKIFHIDLEVEDNELVVQNGYAIKL